MSENSKHITRRDRRRKPGRAHTPTRIAAPDGTGDLHQQYDEHPEQAPTGRYRSTYTTSGRAQAQNYSHGWRSRLTARRALIGAAGCTLALSATIALIAASHKAAHQKPSASSRAAASPHSTISASAGQCPRERRHLSRPNTPAHPHPASRPSRKISSEQTDSAPSRTPPETSTAIPAPEVPPAPIDTSSQPQAVQPYTPTVPPARAAPEEQTGGGPFSP